MKVRIDNKYSPCEMCFIKGVSYDPDSIHCMSCDYNIAVTLLKRVLKENDYCTLCKNRKRLGGGYWECQAAPNDDNYCKNGENLIIDWEAACKEYGIEYTKEG